MKKLLLLPFLLLVIPVANATREHYNGKFQDAIYKGDLESLKHGIENDHYLDISQMDKYDYSGLMTAAYWGQKEAVVSFLEVEGIDIYHKCRGQTALDIAIYKNKGQVRDMLQLRIDKDLKEVNRIVKKNTRYHFYCRTKRKVTIKKNLFG